jgi:hypothetical protein
VEKGVGCPCGIGTTEAGVLSLAIYTVIIIAATIPTADVYTWWGHYMLFPVVVV